MGKVEVKKALCHLSMNELVDENSFSHINSSVSPQLETYHQPGKYGELGTARPGVQSKSGRDEGTEC